MCIHPLLPLTDTANEKAVKLHIPASACLGVRHFLSYQFPQVGHCPCKADVFKDASLPFLMLLCGFFWL